MSIRRGNSRGVKNMEKAIYPAQFKYAGGDTMCGMASLNWLLDTHLKGMSAKCTRKEMEEIFLKSAVAQREVCVKISGPGAEPHMLFQKQLLGHVDLPEDCRTREVFGPKYLAHGDPDCMSLDELSTLLTCGYAMLFTTGGHTCAASCDAAGMIYFFDPGVASIEPMFLNRLTAALAARCSAEGYFEATLFDVAVLSPPIEIAPKIEYEAEEDADALLPTDSIDAPDGNPGSSMQAFDNVLELDGHKGNNISLDEELFSDQQVVLSSASAASNIYDDSLMAQLNHDFGLEDYSELGLKEDKGGLPRYGQDRLTGRDSECDAMKMCATSVEFADLAQPFSTNFERSPERTGVAVAPEATPGVDVAGARSSSADDDVVAGALMNEHKAEEDPPTPDKSDMVAEERCLFKADTVENKAKGDYLAKIHDLDGTFAMTTRYGTRMFVDYPGTERLFEKMDGDLVKTAIENKYRALKAIKGGREQPAESYCGCGRFSASSGKSRPFHRLRTHTEICKHNKFRKKCKECAAAQQDGTGQSG